MDPKMKMFFFFALLVFQLTGVIRGEEAITDYTSLVPQPWVWPFTIGSYATTETWQFPQPVCAQMKVVSTGERTPHMNPTPRATAELRPWSAPSHRWKKFLVFVYYLNCESLKPARFRFVLPTVTLKGSSANFEQPADSEFLWLFNKSSTGKDIRVQHYPIPGTPILGQEYKVLRLSSEREKLAWAVYVRFSSAAVAER